MLLLSRFSSQQSGHYSRVGNEKILSFYKVYNIFYHLDETWCKHKTLIIQAFGVNALEEYAVITNEKVEILMEYIEAKINVMPKAPINIFELVSKCILDTICEIITGVNINVQRNSQNIHAKALQQ